MPPEFIFSLEASNLSINISMINILFIDILRVSIIFFHNNGDSEMELTHLRYFVTVAEELHFGRAAAKLHIAQPPLSQQIKRLETELDVKLFNRTSRRVELTVAGEMFLAEARGIIERADETYAMISSLGKGQKGYLPIAFIESAINTFLPEIIKSFMQKYPDVQLSLKAMGMLEQFRAFDEKRLHLGFIRPFKHDISAYSKRLIIREPYVLALPENHKLCANEVLSLDMLTGEPLILFPRSRHPHLRNRFDECFQRAGVKPDVIMELMSKHTSLAMVKSGIALAFIPESSMFYSPEGVTFRKLDSDLPPIEIYAIWRPENDSPLIKNFLDLIPEI
jgi:DNA-binding transcriptional LysR family regulator